MLPPSRPSRFVGVGVGRCLNGSRLTPPVRVALAKLVFQGQVKATGDLHRDLSGRLDELQSTSLKAQEEKFGEMQRHMEAATKSFEAKENYLENVAKAASLEKQLLEAQLAQQVAIADEASERHKHAVAALKGSQEVQAELVEKCKEQITASMQWKETGKQPPAAGR